MLSIHLGAHKTASTHLQFSLRQVEEQLRERGLAYADPRTLRKEMPLSDALAKGSRSKEAAECRRQLTGLRESHETLLLSEENILGGTHRNNLISKWGMLYPNAGPRIRRVIDLAGGGPATLFLSVRDPAAYNVSAFALQVQQGNEVDIGHYLRGRDPSRIRWSGLVRRLSFIPAVEKIVVWRYEDYRALRPLLLNYLLSEDLAALVPEPPPSNVSMTQPGYEWFLAKLQAGTDLERRVLVRRAQRRFSRADGHPPLRLFEDDVYARSAVNYATEITRIRRQSKVEFLDP
ncbi:hypothetical protein [Paracoccus aestuariivivens]|uniref:Sulfotransferase family protein n=1 Tax=Paracoccus aestuariivivens TaxID=1820333 RepID=A0A6L6J707_9RHOB|nr:hypothetical protein [Paracoccus aestuariivivens]MTH77730.1 hypothetical protein [Paracoccus aestuariivivens]